MKCPKNSATNIVLDPTVYPVMITGRKGAYFITIVTKNRKHFFGEITDGKMILNALGKMAEKFWRDIPQHFAFVRLDEFVIMPNHVHGVLFIDGYKNIDTDNVADNNVNRADNVADNVETLHATSLRTNERNKTNGKTQKMAQISPKRGSLSTVVRSYKSAVTRNSRRICPDFAWQSNYYDRVIRNEQELNRIRVYIMQNPQMWERDRNNTLL